MFWNETFYLLFLSLKDESEVLLSLAIQKAGLAEIHQLWPTTHKTVMYNFINPSHLWIPNLNVIILFHASLENSK